jgi:pimeloyl-ACP methyl ester carboxylesterase
MSTITTKDGTKIAYRDWGKGQPVLFSHGWPLTGDAWEAQMLFFGQNSYRVIAHDRRGHGKSDQPRDGNNMNRYADDLAELIERLDLNNLVLVGHSTGGGEVAQLMGMQGGIKGEYDCIHEFSEVDYTADLKKIDKPTLVVHGDDDQIVPIAASAEKTAKIVKSAQLKVYKGGSHGLAQVDPEIFNADLLTFVRS